jgi:hypothetical protein
MLDGIVNRYPAQHYVMVDDKLSVLTTMKLVLGRRLTTVLPRQGHYALDSAKSGIDLPADITIQGIGNLLDYDPPALLQSPDGMPSRSRKDATSPVDTRY